MSLEDGVLHLNGFKNSAPPQSSVRLKSGSWPVMGGSALALERKGPGNRATEPVHLSPWSAIDLPVFPPAVPVSFVVSLSDGE